MARMTGQNMIDLVREFLGGPPVDQITDTTILRCLNLAYRSEAVQLKDPRLISSFNITTSSNTASYEYPSGGADAYDILEVVDTTNSVRLEQINIMQYNMYTQGDSTATTGNPQYYHLQGFGTTYPKVWFYPCPNGAFTIVFYAMIYPAELAVGTNPITHQGLDEAILWAGAAKAAAIMQDSERYKMAMALYNEARKGYIPQVRTERSMRVTGAIGT